MELKNFRRMNKDNNFKVHGWMEWNIEFKLVEMKKEFSQINFQD
jgi:hypothetical protein